MAIHFRLQPDELDRIAADLDTAYAGDYARALASLQGVNDAIAGAWTGGASQAFNTMHGSWIKRLEVIGHDLPMIATFLRAAADEYRKRDAERKAAMFMTHTGQGDGWGGSAGLPPRAGGQSGYSDMGASQGAGPYGGGLITRRRLQRWTGLRPQDLRPEVWNTLQSMRFGDTLLLYGPDGFPVDSVGMMVLDDNGQLSFGGKTALDLNAYPPDTTFVVVRHAGGESYISYLSQPNAYARADLPYRSMGDLGTVEFTVGYASKIRDALVSTAIGTAAGAAIEAKCGGCGRGTIVAGAAAAGLAADLAMDAFQTAVGEPGTRFGDQVFISYYADDAGNIWYQTAVVRDDVLISYTETPYTTPWWRDYLPEHEVVNP